MNLFAVATAAHRNHPCPVITGAGVRTAGGEVLPPRTGGFRDHGADGRQTGARPPGTHASGRPSRPRRLADAGPAPVGDAGGRMPLVIYGKRPRPHATQPYDTPR